jgi:PAT family beta-lactamase induction signal transducer AmpG
VSLAERPELRLFTLSAMFFAQGIGWAFMAITIPAYLAGQGMTAAATGSVVYATVLPFAFKWVWGPIMDAFAIERFGRRRVWIVFAQAMMAVSAAALLAIDDFAASFDLVLAVILVHTIFSAMQNVAVDALALDLLAPSERGRANGFMYGSKYIGGIVGGIVGGTLLKQAGMTSAIATLVAVLGALTAVPLLVSERSGPPPPRRRLDDVLASLGRVAQLRSVQVAALLMLIQGIAGGMLAAVSPVLFVQRLHWDVVEYSDLAGGVSLVAGFVGSIAAGFVADKIGHKKLAALAVAALASAWIVFALAEPWWSSRTLTYPLFVLEPFLQSTMVVALWAVCMDTTSRKTSTTQFAVYTSLMNASTIIGSRWLVRHVGSDYQTIYIVAGAIQLAAVALVPLIDLGQARRELAE